MIPNTLFKSVRGGQRACGEGNHFGTELASILIKEKLKEVVSGKEVHAVLQGKGESGHRRWPD